MQYISHGCKISWSFHYPAHSIGIQHIPCNISPILPMKHYRIHDLQIWTIMTWQIWPDINLQLSGKLTVPDSQLQIGQNLRKNLRKPTGCPTKHAPHGFCLISLATNMLKSWDIIHWKGGIHSFVWSTKTFLYNIQEPRYEQSKMGYQISKCLNIGQS